MSTTSTNDAMTILVGLISFAQPGIWTALSNLGAGGLAEPFYANAATLIAYLIMFFLSPLFSVAIRRLNVKWVLAFGTLGFAPWSASLYYGLTVQASALWVAESAGAVGDPENHRRGLYISIGLAPEQDRTDDSGDDMRDSDTVVVAGKWNEDVEREGTDSREIERDL
ncbi:hypothetical protein BDW62DRAFT_200562 [Aspergillus aurantiobrunneus]